MENYPFLPTVQDNYEISFSEVLIPETRKLVPDTIPDNISPTAVIKTSKMTIALSVNVNEFLSQVLVNF